ncbi:MAG TPA: VOC family protein [Gaiellaceae bacterium]|jgi:catechol 2,3-dioxygenase-like lactoylglutathione lyase family enzyme|nr:VOC family protein [Gaiellaceae bacterium]
MIDLKRVDHIGVVVEDLATASSFLTSVFGLVQSKSLEREDLRAAFFRCGDASVELVEYRDPDERARRLPPGAPARLDHIAIEIDDVGETLASLEAAGVVTQGPPRATAAGTSVWTDGKTSGGVVYQLVQVAR